jgi:septal ring factor EnvC (AmiA/AmiB activator)
LQDGDSPSQAKGVHVKKISKQIEACKKRISEERDNLRNIIDELQNYEEVATRAVESLEEAAYVLDGREKEIKR